MSSRRPRSRFLTDPIGCDVPSQKPATTIQETEFEKRRGISRIELRRGLAQVHISELAEPLTGSRIKVLEALSEAGISLDFLKLTQSGLTFLVANDLKIRISEALAKMGVRFSIRDNQCMVLVNAVNMRDEEGLIARVVSIAIGSGAPIDHLGDMHDSLLIVTSEEGATKIQAAVESSAEVPR